MQTDFPAKSKKRAQRRKTKAVRYPGNKRDEFRSNRWHVGISGKPLMRLIARNMARFFEHDPVIAPA